ncbi:hypothetical protein F5J12DRAFT_785933 [Pisolithus orientalis]|uniref:uncharacterized protein n=1 Tax=Pisolithus orientalis TaxID=936130 RepID=UPI0022246A2D|nr:uncharacterized protein F5J12DRAFT_785933 [Pisolithus orientalis]KAI5993811.1 hypothetical protein F5J12DRAFT_785933 [Pisolithus orientalis]
MEELTGPSLRAKHQAQLVDKGKGKELGTDETQRIWLLGSKDAPTETMAMTTGVVMQKLGNEEDQNREKAWGHSQSRCGQPAAKPVNASDQTSRGQSQSRRPMKKVKPAVNKDVQDCPSKVTSCHSSPGPWTGHPMEIITPSWLPQSWSHARSIATDPPITPAPTTTTGADDLCHCDEYQEEVTILKQENADMRFNHPEVAQDRSPLNPPASFEGGASFEVPPSNVKAVHGPAGGLAISITPPPPAVGSVPRQEDTGKPIWYGDVCTKAMVLQVLRANGVMHDGDFHGIVLACWRLLLVITRATIVVIHASLAWYWYQYVLEWLPWHWCCAGIHYNGAGMAFMMAPWHWGCAGTHYTGARMACMMDLWHWGYAGIHGTGAGPASMALVWCWYTLQWCQNGLHNRPHGIGDVPEYMA